MAGRMYIEEKEGTVRKVLTILAELMVVATLSLFLANFLLFSVKTESRSMEPTVSQNSVVFVNRMAYVFREPGRLDVVAFYRDETKPTSDILVRRLIALPGDSIRIEKGVVYVNGEPLDLSETTGEITSDGIAGTEMILKDNEYFVLGDTPANSEDSRSSTIGLVQKGQLIGRAWLNATSIAELKLIR